MNIVFEDSDMYYKYKVFLRLLTEKNVKMFLDKNTDLYTAEAFYNFKSYILLFSKYNVLGYDFKDNIQEYLNEVRFCNLKMVKKNNKDFFVNNIDKLLWYDLIFILEYLEDETKKKIYDELKCNFRGSVSEKECIKYFYKNDREYLIEFIDKIIIKDKKFDYVKDIWNNIKLNYLREYYEFVYEDVRVWIISWVNFVIFTVNNSLESDYINFCRREMVKRTNDHTYLDKRDINDVSFAKQIPILMKSMRMDEVVLNSHSIDVDEATFNKLLPIFINGNEYLMTLSCIIKEYPYLFFSPLFKSRCKCVLENIKYYRKDCESVVDYYLNILNNDREKKKNLII